MARPIPCGIAYGPVVSRRFGRSLGIDLGPGGGRVCTFDCVYCDLSGPPRARSVRWPSPGDVRSALVLALAEAGELDSITLSGRGEPTLHPRFGAVVAEVLGEARRSRSGVPVRVLTNGSGVMRPEVRRALERVDECVVSWDAGGDAVARPRDGSGCGVRAARLGLLPAATVQACFVTGRVSNSDAVSVAAWIDVLGELRPRAVQITTVSRPPAWPGVLATPAHRLEEIARDLRGACAASVSVFS